MSTTAADVSWSLARLTSAGKPRKPTTEKKRPGVDKLFDLSLSTRYTMEVLAFVMFCTAAVLNATRRLVT